MMNKSLFVLFVAVVSCVLSAQINYKAREEEGSTKVDFRSWLSSLDVEINQTIAFEDLNIPIKLYESSLITHYFIMSGEIYYMRINDIHLQSIYSETGGTSDSPSFYFKIVLTNVHAEGDWASIGSGTFKALGFVPIDVGPCSGYADMTMKEVILGVKITFEKDPTTGLIKRSHGTMKCNEKNAKDNDLYIEVKEDGMKLVFYETDGLMSVISKEKLSELASSMGPSLLKSMLFNIRNMACPMIEELITDDLTDALNMGKDLIIEFQEQNHPIDIPVVGEMVDLHTSPLIDTARFLFTNFVGVNGPMNLSYIVNIFSNGTGTIRLKDFYEDDIEFDVPIDALGATLTLGIDDIILEGLNTWKDFNILEPINDVQLLTYTNLTYMNLTLKWHVVAELSGEGTSDAIKMKCDNKVLRESAAFNVVLQNNALNFTLQLASYNNLAQNYSNRMCMNTTCMEALLSSDSTGITQFQIHMEFDVISLLDDTGGLEEDIRSFINKLVALFVDNYKLAIPDFVNGLVMSYIQDINDLLSGALAGAYCDDDPDPEIIEVDVPVTAGSVGGASVLTALLMLLPCSGLLKKKRVPDDDEEEAGKNECEMSDLAETYVEGAGAAGMKKEESKDDKYLFKNVKCGDTKFREFLRIDEEGASLFLDPRLSLATRVIIPLLLFCTFAMFLSANTGVGASVFVVMTLGDARDVTLPSLFDFGLINTIEDMWTAGVYPLSILVAFFSGIWPYLKVVLMILCWFLPKKIFSEKARGSMLEWLDILGKWSLLDTYVMIMMLVAFHFNIQFPIVNSEDITKPTAIQIFVYPAYGFLALILGTLFSLIMSHVLLGLHRYVQPDDHMNDCDDAKRWRPLILYGANGKNSVLRLVTRIGLSAGLVVSLIMMIFGTVLNTFSFDFVGLVGWLLPMLDIDPHRAYSVLSLTEEVPGSAQEPNSFTVRFTQVVFIMTAFIFPVLHILSMLVLWLVPLKRKVQHYLHYACEVLSAWSCVDVFIISIIAACLEIRQFAGFMVGDKCDFLTPYLSTYFADFVGEYQSCFEVIATLESGCYVLFFGTIIYTAVYIIFNRVVVAGLRTRGNNGIPMTDEQVKELENRGKNKKDKKDKDSKDVQDAGDGQGQAFGEGNVSNVFMPISTSNKSFVASVSTLTIATTPREDGSYEEEREEEEEDDDTSVEDLEAPGEAPLPPAFEEVPTV